MQHAFGNATLPWGRVRPPRHVPVESAYATLPAIKARSYVARTCGIVNDVLDAAPLAQWLERWSYEP